MSNFKLFLIEDFSENQGNPDVDVTEFDSLEGATAAFESELSTEYYGHGKLCTVEIHDDEDNILRSDTKVSALLPEDGVIVTFQHHTYVGYCYKITGIRSVNKGERYDDLHVSLDRCYSNEDAVYDNIDELKEAYENGSSMPMDKIKSGAGLIEDFLYKD